MSQSEEQVFSVNIACSRRDVVDRAEAAARARDAREGGCDAAKTTRLLDRFEKAFGERLGCTVDLSSFDDDVWKATEKSIALKLSQKEDEPSPLVDCDSDCEPSGSSVSDSHESMPSLEGVKDEMVAHALIKQKQLRQVAQLPLQTFVHLTMLRQIPLEPSTKATSQNLRRS